MAVYKLVCHNPMVARTHWNKDLDTREPANCWRIYGYGLGPEGRIATEAEIDLWQQLTEAVRVAGEDACRRAIELVRPFGEFVNVTMLGGTPEEALRKEFGL